MGRARVVEEDWEDWDAVQEFFGYLYVQKTSRKNIGRRWFHEFPLSIFF